MKTCGKYTYTVNIIQYNGHKNVFLCVFCDEKSKSDNKLLLDDIFYMIFYTV